MAERSMPMNLITADELAEKLKKFHCPLSSKDLEKLAFEDRIPYFAWVIPGNNGADVHEPLFQFTNTKDWLVENGWLSFKEGDPPVTPKKGTPLRKRIENLEAEVRAIKGRLES